jgi:G3E family GTPase
VALTFLGTELRDFTRLDSIITLVDSENFSLDLFNSEAAYNQIAYGDIILLNKTDLVSPERVDQLETRVREIKAGARIMRTTKSQAPLPLILSVGLFESDQYFQPEAEDHSHDHEHTDDCDHESHNHDHHDHAHHDHAHHNHDHHDHSHHLENDGFTSLSFQSDRPLAIKKFQHFLDNLLPENVFRAKGILWFAESPSRHIFHLSGKRFSIEDEEWLDRKQQNQLVLIGQELDHETLRSQLQDCLC